MRVIKRNKIKPTLYIIGDGDERQKLTAQVKDASLEENVKFLGFRFDVSELITGSDMLLMSSDSEGIPTVLLEAIYRGVPIVATAVGGIPEVMELFSGYPSVLVAPSDNNALADAIENLLEAKLPKTNLVHIQQIFERHFAPEVAAVQHVRLYAGL